MSDTSSQHSQIPSSEEEVYDEGVRLHTHKGKLEEILDKATKIAPFLDHDQLRHIFKDYFENENIFLTKLKMMADSRQVKDDDGWIVQSGGTSAKKAVSLTKEEEALKAKYQNYNFLEDKELIARVQRRDQPRPKEDRYKAEQKKDWDNKPKRNKFVEKKQEKKEERKEEKKEEPAKVQKTKTDVKETTAPTDAPRPKYVQKKQQVKEASKQAKVEKKDSPKKEVHAEATKETPKETPKVVKQTSNTDSQKEPKQQAKPKIEDKPAQPQPTKTPEVKPTTTSAAPAHPTPEPPKPTTSTAQPALSTHISEPHPTHQITSASSIKSATSDNDMSDEVKQTFAKSCKENPYILGFLKPNKKVQKIQYVSTPDGRATEVRIRVLADK